jgi:hypothetical protein
MVTQIIQELIPLAQSTRNTLTMIYIPATLHGRHGFTSLGLVNHFPSQAQKHTHTPCCSCQRSMGVFNQGSIVRQPPTVTEVNTLHRPVVLASTHRAGNGLMEDSVKLLF